MKQVSKQLLATLAITTFSAILIWNGLAEAVLYYEMYATGATSRAELADDFGLGLLTLMVVPPATFVLTVIIAIVAWQIIKKCSSRPNQLTALPDNNREA